MQEMVEAVDQQFAEERDEREQMVEETVLKIMQVVNDNKEEMVQFIEAEQQAEADKPTKEKNDALILQTVKEMIDENNVRTAEDTTEQKLVEMQENFAQAIAELAEKIEAQEQELATQREKPSGLDEQAVALLLQQSHQEM